MHTPLLTMLMGMRGREWLHMPGHGGRLPWLDASLDTTELWASDDLHDPQPGGAIEQAQNFAAKACGAGHTVFLAGGSTLGVQAMILRYVPPGELLILPRTVHKSAIAACALGDVRPHSVWPRQDARQMHAFMHEDDIIRAMREHPQAAAVLVTRPDYYGVCLNIAPIAREARRLGMKLLVDEAHGAHFPYGGAIASAGALGADAWVQSAHKTLPALTQSAYLHLRDAEDAPEALRVIRLLSSSSPSFLLAASLDWARAVMSEQGAAMIEQTRQANAALRKSVPLADSHTQWRAKGHVCDDTRVVLDAGSVGMSGYDLQLLLARQGIDVEMADARRIVCLPPLGVSDAHTRLKKALCGLAPGNTEDMAEKGVVMAQIAPAPCAISVRQAVFSPGETVALEASAGRVAAEAAGVYPPGVPLLWPGEVITSAIVDAFKDTAGRGGRLFGCDTDTIRVVKDEAVVTI